MTPSDPREILAECARRGIVLRPHESGSIWYSAPKGALTEDLRRAILRHKAEIVRLLTEAAQYDSLDYRRDPATGAWIHEPGWWRNIPQHPPEPLKVADPAPLPSAEGRMPSCPVTLARRCAGTGRATCAAARSGG
jgi:hypothetical protein